MNKYTFNKNNKMSNFNYNDLINTACDNIKIIFDKLEIDYKLTQRRIVGRCPIHDGDNNVAWNFYPDGHTMRGFWSCYTHHCEEKWGRDLLGCISGILFAKTGIKYNKDKIIKWLCKTLNYQLKEIPEEELKRSKYSNVFDVLSEADGCDDITIPTKIDEVWTTDEIYKVLKIPAEYYVQRGYSSEILKKYDIGLNAKYNRVMVPIFNMEHKHIHGFVGRSIFKQCPKCKLYHAGQCPTNEQEKLYAVKWRTNKGLYTSNYLFNLWFARPHIEKSGNVILVEGVGDVLRLEEAGIHNSVALFGIYLFPSQLKLLQNLRINKIISCLDSDKAGRYGNKVIQEKLGRIYYLHFPAIQKKDIGDMTIEEIRSLNLNAQN